MGPRSGDARILAQACRPLIVLHGTAEDAEYSYSSLPLCVLDAVFSINAHYSSVVRVVERFCGRFGWIRNLPRDRGIPERHLQRSTADFLECIRGIAPQELAESVLVNRARTSTRSGILKADAVARMATVLDSHGIQHLQDAIASPGLEAAEGEVRRIPGQGSGLSWTYFLMLAGREDVVKADRMVIGFLERVVGQRISAADAHALLAGACDVLKPEFPELTPRRLDGLIWRVQSGRAVAAERGGRAEDR